MPGPIRLPSRLLLAGLVLALGLAGCSGSRPPAEVAADRENVLGTWTYRTQGVSDLQRGSFRIHVQDGKLVARVRDRWRGELTARIRLRGRNMTLFLDDLRISGQVQRGRFDASVETDTWGVRHRTRSQPDGAFRARRIQKATGTGSAPRYGCPSLLWESSYACRPQFSD